MSGIELQKEQENFVVGGIGIEIGYLYCNGNDNFQKKICDLLHKLRLISLVGQEPGVSNGEPEAQEYKGAGG